MEYSDLYRELDNLRDEISWFKKDFDSLKTDFENFEDNFESKLLFVLMKSGMISNYDFFKKQIEKLILNQDNEKISELLDLGILGREKDCYDIVFKYIIFNFYYFDKKRIINLIESQIGTIDEYYTYTIIKKDKLLIDMLLKSKSKICKDFILRKGKTKK